MEPYTLAWPREACGEVPGYLTWAEVLTFGGLRALAHMRPVRSASDWSDRTGRKGKFEGSYTSASFVRIRGGVSQGFLLQMGAYSPFGTWSSDWDLRVSDLASGTAQATVISCKTVDGEMANKSTYLHAREVFGEVLRDGARFRTIGGLPDFGRWVEPVLGGAGTPFANDQLLPLPAAFHDRVRISLPEGSSSILAAIMREDCTCSRTHQGAVVTMDLSYGSPEVPARLHLVDDGAKCWLELVVKGFDALPMLTQQRLFQNTIMALRFLTGLLRDQPIIAAPIEGYLAELLGPSQAVDRVDQFLPVSDETRPSFEVELVPGRPLPVGVVITTTQKYAMDRLREAQGSLLARQRSWSRGMRKASLAANRQYSLRHPATVGTEDESEPARHIRYVHSMSDDPSRRRRFAPTEPPAWFWDVGFRSLQAPEGSYRSLIYLTGMSTAHHLLAYGPELYALFRHWEHVMRVRDADLEVETMYVDL